ncbi:MAG TPA: carboxypeptidase-like regulatory domain-containing protein [Vicinamibacterales bacterium]
MRFLTRTLLCSAALALVVPAAARAQGAMSVYVHKDTSNTMISGATVCVGTAEEPSKYGYKTTNAQGRADFTNVPATEVLVTATRSGYRGASKTDPATNYSRSVRMNLFSGSGGPTCPFPVQTTRTAIITIIQIPSFSLNNGADTVPAGTAVELWATWKGATPTHYRASENSRFSGAQWQPFQTSGPRPTYRFADTRSGTRTVFFQLRGAQGQTSAVVRDDITVRATRTPRQGPAPCRLQIQRADNALSSDPSPALTETVQIAVGATKQFNSSWPSPNEKRLGFGMHVRRLRNMGPWPMIVVSTFNLAPAAMFTLEPNESRSVRIDLDNVTCVQMD